MKFCPNCGFPLDGKKICDCGYNVVTNEVDKKTYKEYKNVVEDNYLRQCDVVHGMMTAPSSFGMMSNEQYIENARKMGVDSSVTDEEILANRNQTIFNKDPDNLSGDDLVNILLNSSDGNANS